MEHVAIDEVDADSLGDGLVRRRLSSPLGTSNVAINHYRIAPGGGLPGGLHGHADQEEVFVVLEGQATFETFVRDDGDRSGGEVTVDAGEAIRFAPGEFQSGRNDAERDLVVLALGAPRDSDDVRLPVACPACAHDELRLATGGETVTFACPNCEAEFVPRPCPECGDEDLQVTLGENVRPVIVCQGCEAVFESPPVES